MMLKSPKSDYFVTYAKVVKYSRPLQTMTKSNDLRWYVKGFHGNSW